MEVRTANFHLAAYDPAQIPRDDRPQFAVAGRSNVGKSSLINTVLRRKNIARVSQTPGKTQALQFYLINDRIYLVDLPGYGYARVPRAIAQSWGPLVTDYLEGSKHLRLIFLLLDVRREPTADDLRLVDWLHASPVPWQVVLTKVDKLSNMQLGRRRKEIATSLDLSAEELIPFSTVTRRGVAEFWKRVSEVTENKSRA